MADDASRLQDLTDAAFLAPFDQFHLQAGASLVSAPTEAHDRFKADL